MSDASPVERAQSEEFYERFSPKVGTLDWTQLNDRHEQLKLFVNDVLEGASGLSLLDVGCGAGVLTAHLARFGTVTGIDLSSSALRIARELVPRATFIAGSLEVLDADARFDFISLFDVLEHIPGSERPDFLRQVADLLAPGGILFASTPYPDFTEWRRRSGATDLQIVDESVRLVDVAMEAADAGLTVLRYQAFDLWAGSPEYQLFVLGAPPLEPGGPPRLRRRQLDRRMRLLAGPRATLIRRLARAARLARHGRFAAASWAARPEDRPPPGSGP
jgi:2-polyprenyl-3-methyl-5-hydroxy-6-metoxy-1,4-benzoquinol methylase